MTDDPSKSDSPSRMGSRPFDDEQTDDEQTDDEQTVDASLSVDDEQTLIVKGPGVLAGRYRLGRILGEGAYGRVFLGFDEELHRPVAVKVPHSVRFSDDSDADEFLAEARVAASLDHPGIVPVHDVGRNQDGAIYVVSKFVEGQTLKQRINKGHIDFDETIELLIQIAEALHHAHERKVVHRDVKPGNILLSDENGQPYVTDFGLAIQTDELRRDGVIAGTPSYMSPEQASGEGHRLDGRSDIFSLGAVFYQMLTGRKAFNGSTFNEVCHQVVSVDPVPPSELNADIPFDLERICLKALSKRISDRYASAAELADDLRAAQLEPAGDSPEKTIVPHGLRSFGQDDADFFPDLLPGPRSRRGIPESVQFWIRRLEESDPDATFRVGLLYGPSGCGKSSLVKAGVLPRLRSDIHAFYLEATAEDTESRILRTVRRSFSDLPQDLELVQSLQWLRRRGQGKVVLFIDQFEQWLHAAEPGTQEELIRAFCQCDGSALQAVVLVRDDFAMAAARFMEAVDVPITQGDNFATVDMFDERHSVRVLGRFGQAFGKLPAGSADFSSAQMDFLKSVVSGLAIGGKVIPVQLALFAEMIKNRDWEQKTLQQVGGTAGVGVSFLEETFSDRSANPSHLMHQQAAREVLKELMPDIGTNIKGNMRSHEELIRAAGYEDRPKDFLDLLRILDGEIRLITPADPATSQSGSGSRQSEKHYQLTHDYLVPALREWLTREQQKSRSGRARLRLEERETLWAANREERQLPSFFEWLEIRRFVPRNNWSDSERLMMSRASHRYLTAFLLGLCVVLGIFGTTYAIRQSMAREVETVRVNNLVEGLWNSSPERLAGILEELDRTPAERWQPDVIRVANDGSAIERDRTRAWIALAPTDAAWGQEIAGEFGDFSRPEQEISLRRLAGAQTELSTALWAQCERKLQPQQVVRIAAGLAAVDPESPKWNRFSPSAVDALLECDSLFSSEWLPKLVAVTGHLGMHLHRVCLDDSASDSKRLVAASLVAAFNRQRSDFPASTVLQQILMARPAYLRSALSATIQRRQADVRSFTQKVATQEIPEGDSDEIQILIDRTVSAILVQLQLGNQEPLLSALAQERDPRVRTRLINRFEETRFTSLPDSATFNSYAPLARQGWLLGIESLFERLTAGQQKKLSDHAQELLVSDDDAGVHSAAQLLLQHSMGRSEISGLLDEKSAGGNWRILPNGLCMIRIDAPGETEIGTTAATDDSDGLLPRRSVRLDYTFEIGATEVTVHQLRQLLPEATTSATISHSLDSPIGMINLFDAMRYCRLLSEQEPNFDPDRCCYPAASEIGPDMKLARGFLLKPGFRLPTVHEWEYAVRANSTTSRFFGNSASLLDDYAWWVNNSKERLWPAATKRPNPWGLFDVYGNAMEWCHEAEIDFVASGHPVRGGNYRTTQRFLRSSFADFLQADFRVPSMGFRVVHIDW